MLQMVQTSKNFAISVILEQFFKTRFHQYIVPRIYGSRTVSNSLYFQLLNQHRNESHLFLLELLPQSIAGFKIVDIDTSEEKI